MIEFNVRFLIKLSMKIISWNIKGVGGYKKNSSIKETFRKYNPDIVMLQETKKMETNHNCLASFWGNRRIDWISSHAEGSAGPLYIG